MRFTLDGQQFELTPELVRSRLDGHVPEDIREYWVDVDGTKMQSVSGGGHWGRRTTRSRESKPGARSRDGRLSAPPMNS